MNGTSGERDGGGSDAALVCNVRCGEGLFRRLRAQVLSVAVRPAIGLGSELWPVSDVATVELRPRAPPPDVSTASGLLTSSGVEKPDWERA